GDPARSPDPTVPGHQGYPVHDAGGGDEFVGRIAPEVEASDGPADIQRQGPDVDTGERPFEIRVVEIHRNAVQLGQLSDLPQHDPRDAPRLAGEQVVLAPGQLTGERAEQYVRVEIQHPTGDRSRGCRP